MTVTIIYNRTTPTHFTVHGLLINQITLVWDYSTVSEEHERKLSPPKSVT